MVWASSEMTCTTRKRGAGRFDGLFDLYGVAQTAIATENLNQLLLYGSWKGDSDVQQDARLDVAQAWTP